MSSITLNSNIASLKTQRQFGKSTGELQQGFARLSSGLRINRAVDDASGLSISTQLQTDARVFNQGVRNLNDGVSLLNIAEGAASELSTVLIRTRELSTQAANGTLSYTQRKALHQEASALVQEYNRIVESVDFNGRKLIDGEFGELAVQAGYGSDGSISFALGGGLARTVGDGTFEGAVSFAAAGSSTRGMDVSDVNNDGALDVITTTWGDIRVALGNGDGGFKAGVTYFSNVGSGIRGIRSGDLNGDGQLDLVHSYYNNPGDEQIGVLIGNGDGSFRAAVSYLVPGLGAQNSVELADVNNDGSLDALTNNNNGVSILLGNGDGSFQSTYLLASSSNARRIEVTDLNDDGAVDVVAALGSSGEVGVYLNKGDGSFGAEAAFNIEVAGSVNDVKSGDFNGDGIVDIVGVKAGTQTLSVLLGNGDGTYKGRTEFNAGDDVYQLDVADLTGDGVLDFAVSEETGGGAALVGVYIGNGDGTFQARESYANYGEHEEIVIADVDNDGGLDVLTTNFSGDSFSVLTANTQEVTTISEVDLRFRESALEAMSVIDDSIVRVNQELGAIGAAQSRFSTAVANLQVGRENYLAAASRIKDVDVAEEAAKLVRSQILQQASASILAQANQTPALALTLLG